MKLSPRLSAILTKSHRNLKASISSYSNSTATLTLACPCKLRDLFVSLIDHAITFQPLPNTFEPIYPHSPASYRTFTSWDIFALLEIRDSYGLLEQISGSVEPSYRFSGTDFVLHVY